MDEERYEKIGTPEGFTLVIRNVNRAVKIFDFPTETMPPSSNGKAPFLQNGEGGSIPSGGTNGGHASGHSSHHCVVDPHLHLQLVRESGPASVAQW